MRVLIACERFGAVRDAFRAAGHDAWSNDLEDIAPAGTWPNYHLYGDARWFLDNDLYRWDMLIAFPPCTHLAVSGARYFPEKVKDGRQAAALQLVRDLLAAPVPRIALENPVSIISTRIRKPDQIIQPWQFGHPESKTTCLWLKNLPPLVPTQILTRPPRRDLAEPNEERTKQTEPIARARHAEGQDVRRGRPGDGEPMGHAATAVTFR